MSDTANNACSTMSDEVRETVKALTEQVESAVTALESKGMLSVMQISQVHGFPYKGPTVRPDPATTSSTAPPRACSGVCGTFPGNPRANG